MALPKTDAFTGTNGNTLTTYNAGWVLPYGTDLEIRTNAVACAGSNARCTARWHGDTWPNDQYAQAKVIAVSDGIWGVMVRHTTAVAITYYGGGHNATEAGNTKYRIWKYVGGTYTSIDVVASATPQVNDVVRLEVSGSSPITLTLKVNGSTVLGPTADPGASIASGEAGLTAFHSVASTPLMDDFDGGALTVASTRKIFIGSGLGKVVGG